MSEARKRSVAKEIVEINTMLSGNLDIENDIPEGHRKMAVAHTLNRLSSLAAECERLIASQDERNRKALVDNLGQAVQEQAVT